MGSGARLRGRGGDLRRSGALIRATRPPRHSPGSAAVGAKRRPGDPAERRGPGTGEKSGPPGRANRGPWRGSRRTRSTPPCAPKRPRWPTPPTAPFSSARTRCPAGCWSWARCTSPRCWRALHPRSGCPPPSSTRARASPPATASPGADIVRAWPDEALERIGLDERSALVVLAPRPEDRRSGADRGAGQRRLLHRRAGWAQDPPDPSAAPPRGRVQRRCGRSDPQPGGALHRSPHPRRNRSLHPGADHRRHPQPGGGAAGAIKRTDLVY